MLNYIEKDKGLTAIEKANKLKVFSSPSPPDRSNYNTDNKSGKGKDKRITSSARKLFNRD